MKHKLSSILGVTAVLIATLLLLGFVQRLLMPKHRSATKEGHLPQEYYAETTEHDVLFLGDCEVFSNFSPVTLWTEYGIPSYIRGGAQQLVWHSYYTLLDTLKTETPKVVVYNVLALKYGEPQSEAYNRLNLDGLRLSGIKLRAVHASMTEGEELLSYVFPLLRYHARWSELGAEDWTALFSDPPVSHNGYLMETSVRPLDRTPTPPMLHDPDLPASSMEWLKRMTELCRENGIRLVLIKSPSVEPHWYAQWDAQIVAFAEENGLDYYNLLHYNEEIGIDYSTDTFDMGQHLNVYGAEKASRWLGAKLTEYGDLADRRGDRGLKDVWDEKVLRYEQEKKFLENGGDHE